MDNQILYIILKNTFYIKIYSQIFLKNGQKFIIYGQTWTIKCHINFVKIHI